MMLFTFSPRKYSLAGILALASFSAAFRFASSFASRRRNCRRFEWFRFVLFRRQEGGGLKKRVETHRETRDKSKTGPYER